MIQSVNEMLTDMRRKNPEVFQSHILKFHGVDGFDVYNITSPFLFKGKEFMAGRVETRESEISSIRIFERKGDEYYLFSASPPLANHQDPCVTTIKGQLVLGGVRYPVPMFNGEPGWYMEFYTTEDLFSWKSLFRGPDRMKDIRLSELSEKDIGIFSRPQGVKGGRGKIGFIKSENLGYITPELIDSAPLLDEMFPLSEWGGVNQIVPLNRERLGVLGHIACFDKKGGKHYYPVTFYYDPLTGEKGKMKILLERSMLPPGPAKRPDLEDVIFSGGIVRRSGGKAIFYAGIADAFCIKAILTDPFIEYEED